MKKRIFFEKFKHMKFISHLDLIKFLERLFKQAEIEVEYSNGNTPRPKFSFGYPIPLGISAFNEPFDVKLSDELDNSDLKSQLNARSPEGFRIIRIDDITTEQVINKDYNTLIYEVILHDWDLVDEFKKILEQDKIIVKKEKDDKVVEKDIKPNIRQTHFAENHVLLYIDAVSPHLVLKDIANEKDYEVKRIGYTKI